MASRLLCSTFLVAAPLAALAQSASPAPDYRFYGGVALYNSDTQALGASYGGRYKVPVQATLGYQLCPRLAVQVGLAYSGAKGDDRYTDEYLDGNANPINYTSTLSFSRRTYAASALARYTLTRKAAHRFQVDVLAGPSFERSTSSFTSSDATTSQGVTSTSYYEQSYRFNTLLLNAGPSFRYRFGARIEAMYDLLLNVSLTGSNYNPNATMALGLRYRFGQQ